MSDHWDLIVVGAGSAGAALASRCAAKGQRVLLLEAGADYRAADMPELWRLPNTAPALMDPATRFALAWTDLTASRTEAQSAGVYWRGKGVGGSSAINGQIAIRPPMADFSEWAAAGCTGWGPTDVLPYLAKLESDVEFGHAPYHGTDGPIPVSRTPLADWGAVDLALREAALAAGFPWAEDVNAPGATGVSPLPSSTRAGRRVTTNDGYLEPMRERAELTVRGQSHVDRVIFSGKHAVGVEVIGPQGRYQAYGAQIVLSAGAIHSPAILLRSGIGPAHVLHDLGVPIRGDLPVGEGLQEHPALMLPMTLIGVPDAAAFVARHTNCTIRFGEDHGGRPQDLMIIALNMNVLSHSGATLDANVGSVCLWLNETQSRGRLELMSADPYSAPVVHERMLSDRRDLDRMREGVDVLVDLLHRPEMARINKGGPADLAPEFWESLKSGASTLDRYLLENVVDGQHPTGTCRMGGPGDPNAVVDSDCCVLGFDGLRVVDASILPTVPRANTNLVTIMVGEMMADRLTEGGTDARE